MDEKKAREILDGCIGADNQLYDPGHYMAWEPGSGSIVLDDRFDIDEIEAIAWWMRNKT